MGKFRTLAAAISLASIPLASISACSLVSPGGSESGDKVSLTIYSNSVSDGRGDWLKEKASAAGFDLSIVDAGGGDVYNRLVAEKDSPVADVVFGLNDVYFNKLISADVLEKNTPSWADKVKEDTVDATGSYYPIVKEPIMLVCNTANLPDGQMPNDWPDLWEKEQFHQRYEVPAKLGAATTQMVISGILTRHEDANGKLGISQEGWDAVGAWLANGKRAEEGTDLYARMANGDVSCGQMWLAGKFSRDEQYGLTTEAAHPQVGVPMVHQGVAIIKGTKHLEGAKKFEDWFGSAEIQAQWSKQFGTAPTNVDALADGSQEAIEYTNSFTAQDIDWVFVAENLDAWVEEIQLNYVK